MGNGGRLPTVMVVPRAVLRRVQHELRSIGMGELVYGEYAMVPLWDRMDGLGERVVEVFSA